MTIFFTTQRGQFFTPLGGQFFTPIDRMFSVFLEWAALLMDKKLENIFIIQPDKPDKPPEEEHLSNFWGLTQSKNRANVLARKRKSK